MKIRIFATARQKTNIKVIYADGVEPAEFTLKHEFYGRQDRARNLYVQVPLYVGQYLFSTAGIGYWLAGFHVNCAFKGDTRQTLNATTKALYEPFLGVWHEMDNHGAIMCLLNERENDCVSNSMSWRMWKPDTNIPLSITDVSIVPHPVTASIADFALPDSWTLVCSIYVLVLTKTSMPSPRSPSMTSLPIVWIMSSQRQMHGNTG